MRKIDQWYPSLVAYLECRRLKEDHAKHKAFFNKFQDWRKNTETPPDYNDPKLIKELTEFHDWYIAPDADQHELDNDMWQPGVSRALSLMNRYERTYLKQNC